MQHDARDHSTPLPLPRQSRPGRPGRERKDKAALLLGPGRRSSPPASFRAECVRIISLLDTNAGPGGQTCPLVDARPGAEARRHDRALVDAGRTELVVWGIGSSIMVDHDN
ncbi:hypothetical protein THAOC_28075, partial [Thalassiosira oceanica]